MEKERNWKPIDIAGLTTVSGEIVEISASSLDVGKHNSSTFYTFIMVKRDDGSVIKINNVAAENQVKQHLVVGRDVTLYIRSVRVRFTTRNLLFAAQSDIGVGAPIIQKREVYRQAGATLLGALFLAILGFTFLAYPVFAVFMGLGISPLLGGAVVILGLLYLVYREFRVPFQIKQLSDNLRKELLGDGPSGGLYRGAAITEM